MEVVAYVIGGGLLILGLIWAITVSWLLISVDKQYGKKGEVMEDQMVLKAEKIGNLSVGVRVKVVCPFCKKENFHGVIKSEYGKPTHRGSHCACQDSYFIKYDVEE